VLIERAAVFRPVRAIRKTAVPHCPGGSTVPRLVGALMNFKNIATIVVVAGLTNIAIDAYKAKKR
jgi:hypothetical protein